MRELIRLAHIRASGIRGGQLYDLSLEIMEGEIVFLLGLYGSGKRIVKAVLEGSRRPEAGQVFVGERLCPGYDEAAAKDAGIVCVESQKRLMDGLSAADNITLGRGRHHIFALYNGIKAMRGARENLEFVGLKHAGARKAGQISAYEYQLLSIAKARSEGARLPVVDCVNSNAGTFELAHLARLLQTLRAEGMSVLVLSEKQNQLWGIADRAVLLNNGCDAKIVYRDELEDFDALSYLAGRQQAEEPPAEQAGRGRALGFCELDGEHFAGAAGYFTQLWQTTRGGMGWPELLPKKPPRKKMRPYPGVVLIPENSADCMLENLTLQQNLTLPILRKVTARGTVNTAMEQYLYGEFLKDAGVVGQPETPDELSYVERKILSIYRWCIAGTTAIVLENPFVGLDSGETRQLGGYLQKLLARGIHILLLSKNIDELCQLCDEVVVTLDGVVHRVFADPKPPEIMQSVQGLLV